jgi:hypothetical protein
MFNEETAMAERVERVCDLGWNKEYNKFRERIMEAEDTTDLYSAVRIKHRTSP